MVKLPSRIIVPMELINRFFYIERLSKGKMTNVLQQNYKFYLDNIYFSNLNDVDELMDTM